MTVPYPMKSLSVYFEMSGSIKVAGLLKKGDKVKVDFGVRESGEAWQHK